MGLKIILIVVVILIILILAIYNDLVRLRNRVKEKAAGIDVCLKQRFDLIPNLVEVVKGYSKHENSLFTDIASLRSTYMKSDSDLDTGEDLNNKMNKLLAVAENYPELKASEQFLNLQRQLSKIEDELQDARTIYNAVVTRYNNKVETVPSNLVALLFGFKEKKLFEIEDYQKENVNVDLSEKKE